MSSTGAAERSRPHASVIRRVSIVLVASVLLAAVVTALAFWFSGGRWFVVRTPSMGTAAPVGSLVLTRPTEMSALHVGDIVSYHPPAEPTVTYTHRIVAVTARGLRTRGDINGATDPWVVTSRDVIGRATAVPAVGWLLRALPLLVVGGLVLWGVSALWLPSAWRGPVRMAGGAALVALNVVLLKPFVNVVQLASRSTEHGAYLQTVSTGLLPVRLTAQSGHAAPVDLPRSGSVGLSHFTEGKPGQRFLLHTALHLAPWQWALAVFVCVSPLLWTLIIGFRVDEPELEPEAATS